MNKSWIGSEQVMHKSWTSDEQESSNSGSFLTILVGGWGVSLLIETQASLAGDELGNFRIQISLGNASRLLSWINDNSKEAAKKRLML